MAPTMFSCFVPACEFVTAMEEPESAIQLLKFHQEDVHNQKEQVVLKCPECQYTTPEGQDPWIANWWHRTRTNHVAPVRQVKDSEQEVAAKPAQKEGLISPKDAAMPVGSVKTEQLSNRV